MPFHASFVKSHKGTKKNRSTQVFSKKVYLSKNILKSIRKKLFFLVSYIFFVLLQKIMYIWRYASKK